MNYYGKKGKQVLLIFLHQIEDLGCSSAIPKVKLYKLNFCDKPSK